MRVIRLHLRTTDVQSYADFIFFRLSGSSSKQHYEVVVYLASILLLVHSAQTPFHNNRKGHWILEAWHRKNARDRSRVWHLERLYRRQYCSASHMHTWHVLQYRSRRAMKAAYALMVRVIPPWRLVNRNPSYSVPFVMFDTRLMSSVDGSDDGLRSYMAITACLKNKKKLTCTRT